ncbi:hypothetical protein C8F01DRAFT_597037 [Mycena amicta]|nr:hypothetical protein C8F01DRAFT_597037 [Mycena amicta]
MNDDHLFQILNKKRKAVESSPRPAKLSKRESPQDDSEDEEEGWGGIQESDEDDALSEFEQEDDEFSSAMPLPSVVVFASSNTPKSSQGFSAAQKKAFLSSKVSKLRDESFSQAVPTSVTADDAEERTNAQNDALLHRLVHTKLLSGSLNEELDLTPAQRKKALAGRVMELAGGAKLGKGEKRVREGERNKASKQVREGLLRKQKERQVQQLDEAKNVGNYHPSIKKLFEDTSASNAPRKHRERGLKMGVGRFSGGMLKLGKDDISRLQANAFGGSRGRGGRRGGSARGRP